MPDDGGGGSLAGVRRSADAVLRDDRSPIFVAVAFGWLLTLGMRLAVPALLPWIRTAFEVDLTAAGGVLTLVWGAYALAQFPGGALGDWAGERAVLVGSSLVCTAGLVAVALAPTIRPFLAGLALFAGGGGLYATTRFTVLSDVYPDNDGVALGASAAAGNVGTALLPVVAAQVALLVGWRYGFGLAAPLLVVVALALRATVPARTSATGDRGGSGLDLRALLGAVRRRRPLYCAAAMLLLSVVYQSFTGFYPTYLAAEKGLDQGTAALLYGGFFAVGVVLQPIGGALGDRFGKRHVIVGSAAITAVAVAALPVIAGLGPLVALSGLAAVQLCFWPNAQAYVIAALPEGLQGSGFGLLRTVYLVAAASGPLVVGALGDAGAFDAAFYLLAGVAGAGAVLALFLPPLSDGAGD